MKRNLLLVLVVVALSLWFNGCSKYRYLTLPVDANPSRCAEIYLGDVGDRNVVTDLGGLTSVSDGLLYAGRSPLNLYFYFNEDEGLLKKGLKQYIDLPQMVAVWPSGAKVRKESRRVYLGESVDGLFFKRPSESEVAGMLIDLQCEANQLTADRNQIEQEGNSQHGTSNILGAGILCFMSGYCR
jgi:hypothetical protein